jgi:hypothetical protein
MILVEERFEEALLLNGVMSCVFHGGGPTHPAILLYSSQVQFSEKIFSFSHEQSAPPKQRHACLYLQPMTKTLHNHVTVAHSTLIEVTVYHHLVPVRLVTMLGGTSPVTIYVQEYKIPSNREPWRKKYMNTLNGFNIPWSRKFSRHEFS